MIKTSKIKDLNTSTDVTDNDLLVIQTSTGIKSINYGNLTKNKVTKEEGKSLSTNDFTNEEKSKLEGIEENANVTPAGLMTGYVTTGRNSSSVLGICATAEGQNTKAIGMYSHAEGTQTTANNIASHAEGISTKSSANYAHAEGQSSNASGESAHAEGYNTKASGKASHAEGTKTSAKSPNSHAEGYNAISEGDSAHSEGKNTSASELCAHAEGIWTQSLGIGSHAEGGGDYITIDKLLDEGILTIEDQLEYCTIAQGDFSHAEGMITYADGIGSHAEGRMTKTFGPCSHAEGINTEAKNNSHAEGQNVLALGISHAEGAFNIAGKDEYSNGNINQPVAYAAHAEGGCTAALGLYSHAEGEGKPVLVKDVLANDTISDHEWTDEEIDTYFSVASGQGSHVEGWFNKAIGEFSHAEGSQNICNGDNSHVGGINNTCASESGFVHGDSQTTSTSYCNVLFGTSNSCISDLSSTIGGNNTNSGMYSTVLGRYNTNNNRYNLTTGFGCKVVAREGTQSIPAGSAFTIGNGQISGNTLTRSNAFRVTYSGETYGLSEYNSSGADYAEYIHEWFDGNPENEDRIGYFVTVKDEKLYFAQPGDYIAGVTSGNPSVVGNSDEDYYWKYERDEFDRIITEPISVEVTHLEDERDIDKLSSEDITTSTIYTNKMSDKYDPDQEYIHRKDRPEWNYVGMVGVLSVRDDGTCKINEFCKCGKDGVATLADQRGFDTYRVIKRINDHVVKIILK